MKVQGSQNPVRKCISPDGDYYWEGGKLKIEYFDIGRLCLPRTASNSDHQDNYLICKEDRIPRNPYLPLLN